MSGEKVLIIDSRATSDWSMDMLYAGLVQNLGPDRVVDYPAHRKHRLKLPLKRVGDPEKDWGEERLSLGYTGCRSTEHGPMDVRRMLLDGEFGLIFVDERPQTYELFCEIGGPFFAVPTVLVAGHDSFQNVSPLQIALNYKYHLRAMFLDTVPDLDEVRRQLPKLKIERYNWAANFDHLWSGSKQKRRVFRKEYDICFMGYNSHPDRARFIDHVQSRWGHLNNKIIFERRPAHMDLYQLKQEYFDDVARSRIALNLRGAACNGKTLRFYEIPFTGTFMLTQNYQALEQQIHPLRDQQECGVFDDESQLDAWIAWALDDKNLEQRELLAERGMLRLLEKNSTKFRVGEMLKAVNYR